jgi:hypothetical protein
MALTYPLKYAKLVNPETWDRSKIGLEKCKTEDLNGFIQGSQ